MVQESPVGASVLDKYRQRAAEGKGRRSINVLQTAKGSNAQADKGSTDPSHKSKKRSRDGGNIATTIGSPGSLPTPPPCQEAFEVDSPSPIHAEQAAPPPEADLVMEVSMSPLALLGVTFNSHEGFAWPTPKPLGM